MFPTSRDTELDELAGSFTNIQIQARVLYIDFFTLQQVCFRLTTGTLEDLTENHRNPRCDDLKAHSYGDVRIEVEIKGLMENFDLAIEHCIFRTGTGCLEEMEVDGSGELTTQHSMGVKLAILKLFGPCERYLGSFPELLRSRFTDCSLRRRTLRLIESHRSSWWWRKRRAAP
jgi:hypothetical protein